MAEVHLVGTLLGASEFSLWNGQGLCCHWQVVMDYEEAWQLLEGNDSGATHVDIPSNPDGYAVWSHPIDLHYTTNSIQGWPKIVIQVFKQDSWGKYQLGNKEIVC
jgi:B9 domain-containing protein 2